MSKLLRTNSKNQNREEKIQKAQDTYWASDAVDRIARRTPALFKTNRVPHVETRSMNFPHIQPEGTT